jgi:hypothetical protein
MQQLGQRGRMKFRVPELFLGAFLAVAIFSMGILFSSQYPRQAAQSDSPEKADGNATKKDPPKPFWQSATADPAAAFTLGLLIVGIFQAGLFFFQLRLIRKSLDPAKEAADAAKLNAQAVMDAEGAHLYPVIKKSNVNNHQVFFGPIMHGKSSSDTDAVPTPTIVYCFKNYGKTPAVLQSIMHNIDFFEAPSKSRLMHMADISALEIIGANEESADIEFEMLATFNMGMAKSVMGRRGELMFFGEAVFTDFFDRQFRCIWECHGNAGGFKLTRHEQRLDPDKKI